MITEKILEIVNVTGPNTFLPIPVASIPAGRDIKIHVVAKNTSSTSQKLGINWQVWDPAYNLVQEYGPIFEAFTTPPDDSHTFMGPFFSISAPGTYQVYIYLWASVSGGDPQLLDSYIGELGAVGGVQPDEWVPLLSSLVTTSVPVLQTTSGWLPLLTSIVNAQASVLQTTGGWLPLLTSIVNSPLLKVYVTPPPPPPEEGEGFPWLPVLLGTAGAAVIVVSATKKKP